MDPERLQLVELANKAFGDSEWSFSISQVALDYIDEKCSGNYAAGTSAIIRVQRSNGTFREEVGYGSSSGTNKANVICKAKKDAVTDGLKGAIINFGGDAARRVNTVTPRKSSDMNQDASASRQVTNDVLNTPIGPLQVAVAASLVSRNVLSDKKMVTSPLCAQVKPSVSATSPATHPKPDLVKTRVVPVPRLSPPLALPLPQPKLLERLPSEEDLVKAERKRRQRLLQEEFRKKHLLEQAQAQCKVPEKKTNTAQQSREPLKEQQVHRSDTSNGHGTNVLEGDDDVLLSTQDMEAISAIAANNSNVSRHLPMISSPSHVRPPASEAQHQSAKSGRKRPDLSIYDFNREKKSKGV